MTTTTIYIADLYRKGCPSNAQGTRSGIGCTAKTAIAACRPWTNQAFYFRSRARKVLAVDGTNQGADEVNELISEDARSFYRPVPGLDTALAQRQWSVAIRLAVLNGLIS